MRYQESVINPAHSGFGEWDLDRNQDFGYDLDAMLTEARENVGEIYELGKDELPEGMEDIRGSIHNEPTHVYGYQLRGRGSYYFGIDEIPSKPGTLWAIIEERGLNPRVHRSNGRDVGDNWESFFPSELDEPVEAEHHGKVDWWRNWGAILVDNDSQSFIVAL